MEVFTDWKFWLFVITTVGAGVNLLANMKIAGNHLRHLADDVKLLLSKVTVVDEKLARHDERIKSLEKVVK